MGTLDSHQDLCVMGLTTIYKLLSCQCHKFPTMLKVKAVNGTPSHSYGTSLAIWDHTVLPATWHKRMRPALTPPMQAGIQFTYPGGMEGRVDLVDFIAPQLGVEPVTYWSRVWRQTAAPPRQPQCVTINQYFKTYYCSYVTQIYVAVYYSLIHL